MDTARLVSQKDLVKTLIGDGYHLVYCYLRHKDSKNGKAGSPYYVGLASDATRPYGKHEWTDSTGRKRRVPVPQNECLVRILDVLETREEAADREAFFVTRYGRRFVDACGILLNRLAGGDNGGYGNRVPKRRRLNWQRIRDAADSAGVPVEVWLEVPGNQKAAFNAHRRRYPDQPITLDVFLSEVYNSYEESRLRLGWKEVGATEEEWNLLNKRQRTTALNRHDRGQAWNQDSRQNPPRELVETRIQNSARTRLVRGARSLGMPLEVYQSLSNKTRYEIKVWLEKNPGKTWDQRPKYGEQIPSGAENKRMQAGAEKYEVDLVIWAAMSDKHRRTYRKRYNDGKRGDALWKGLVTENDN